MPKLGYNIMAPASAASQLEKVTCPLCLSLSLSLFVDISHIYISICMIFEFASMLPQRISLLFAVCKKSMIYIYVHV